MRKNIYNYIFLSLIIFSCKSNQFIKIGTYNLETNEIDFFELDSNNKITKINQLNFIGINEFCQQNEMLLISNYSKNYNQNHYIIKNGFLIEKNEIKLNEFQSAVANLDDYSVLNITDDDDENNYFTVFKDSISLKVNYSDNKISFDDRINNNLKVIFTKIRFLDETTSALELTLLDLKKKTSKIIYKVTENSFGDSNKWFLGYYYFKNESTFIFSKYKINSDQIIFELFEYSVINNKLNNYKEFSIPNKGKSISNLLFKVLDNNEILITDNKNIYIIRNDNTFNKVYEANKDSEVVYINSKIK